MNDAAEAASLRTVSFGSLRIAHDERVLAPRTWTTAQSEWVADLLPEAPPGTVLELCAGAGHIGLLAVAHCDRRLVAVDADPVAANYARRNAAAAGLEHRVEVREDRFETALGSDEEFAVVIADPPWVRTGEIDRYPQDPRSAIDGGDDGLGIARACVRVIEEHLMPGGFAVLQLGTAAQAQQLGAEVQARGRLRVLDVRVLSQGTLARLGRVDTPAPATR